MKLKSLFILLFICILAAALRLYQLGNIPPSPDWDEAALGYNAYSILKTGKDEYGKFLPIILRSFDDYKPALYAYLTIPSIVLFGLNTFAVRLPSAVFGTLTVIAVYFIVLELTKKGLSYDSKYRDKRYYIALLSTLLLAISPWHLQFSRIAFESNVGLAFNIFGLLLFLKGLKKPWLLIFSVICFSLSLYAYQSEKVFTPLFVLLLIVIFYKNLLNLPKKYLLSFALIGIIITTPLIYVTFSDKSALMRAKGVSIFSERTQLLQSSVQKLAFSKKQSDLIGEIIYNRRIVYAKQIIANYLSHFDLNWLFIRGDIARHHAPDMGLLYLFELPFLLIGFYQLLFGIWPLKTKLLIFGWFFIAPIPASITSGVPHAVRTLNFLPTFQIFSALGIIEAIRFSIKYIVYSIWYKILIIILYAFFLIFSTLNIIYYFNQYFVQQNIENSKDWQYGYQRTVETVKSLQNNYNKIIVSNKPYLDQSYMFFLFYLQYPPEVYQQQTKNVSGGFRENHIFGKYEFRPIDWPKEINNDSILYVNRADDFPVNATLLGEIYFLDNKPAIKIIKY
jgi:4-amino-4-deoxy-L-arabinose transferase-like glycosyltransferase